MREENFLHSLDITTWFTFDEETLITKKLKGVNVTGKAVQPDTMGSTM